MKLSKVASDATNCLLLTDVVSSYPQPATQGLWSFKWNAASEQTITYPSEIHNYTNGYYASIFGQDKQVILGIQKNSFSSGSFSVDWLRVRKLAIDPLFTLGSEQEYPVAPNATNDGPFCGGDTIHFSSTQYAGAIYNWKNPSNLPFSSLYNPTLASNPSLSGVYTLEVSVPGCPPVISQTTVDVSQTSVAGTTTGDAIICSGTNSGNAIVFRKYR